MQKLLSCVYCGSLDDITRDHVPPKGFFPKPLPSNLITVPSCRNCNNGYGKDEELFLATFMFTEAGVSEVGKNLWDEKLHRMYEKNSGLKKQIARSLEKVELKTPGGIYLGNGMTIRLDRSRSENVVNKIVRGLYYFEYQKHLLPSVAVNSRFVNNESDIPIELKEIIPSFSFGTRQWVDIFEYRHSPVIGHSEKSIWLLRFFGKAVFYSITGSYPNSSHTE